MSSRIHYLDWLRLSAVLAVVVYHALLPFSGLPWHVRDVERSDALALLTAPLPFAFPLFFLLAGASSRFALQTRSVRAFLRERTARLLVPFVVGWLVLAVPTSYFIAMVNGTWSGSFLAYLAAVPALIRDVISGVGFRPVVLPIITMHLWFLAWLFLYCLLAAPLFAYLSTPRGRSLMDRLAGATRWRGASLLFAVPITLIALLLFGVSSPAGWDWAAFALWGVTFVGGYLLFSDERLVAAARRDLPLALAAAGLGVAGLAATGFTTSVFQGGAHTYDATYVLVVSLHGLTTWAVTLAVLGAAMGAGFMQRPLQARHNEMALPTYLLHLPIVIAISALVVQWPLDLLPKAVINVGFGLAATLLVVAVVVRVPIIRPLLGLRRVPGGAEAGAAAPSPAIPLGRGSRPLRRSSRTRGRRVRVIP